MHYVPIEGFDKEYPMNCPHCQNPVNIGELLSQIRSPAKARASRENGKAPVKNGKKGWPKGKPRKKGKV